MSLIELLGLFIRLIKLSKRDNWTEQDTHRAFDHGMWLDPAGDLSAHAVVRRNEALPERVWQEIAIALAAQRAHLGRER